MENKSGIVPFDYKVLIKTDAVEEKKGSLYIPDTVKDREKYAIKNAHIVAIGSTAFYETIGASLKLSKILGKEESLDSIVLKMPKVGDRVIIGQYAGDYVMGEDGVEYKLVNDRDIWAVIKGEDNKNE